VRVCTSIIILNWNGWEDTLECLDSIFKAYNFNFNIVLLDNASSDSSVQEIRSWVSQNVPLRDDTNTFQYVELTESDLNRNIFNNFSQLGVPKFVFIKNDTNYGFAEGNNIGARFAIKYLGSQYILLLNNDMIVQADFLQNLLTYIGRSEEIAVCSSKILFYHDPTIINYAGAAFTLLGRGDEIGFGQKDLSIYNVQKITGVPSGGAMLIRAKVIVENGLFDKAYFAYHEDTDFAWRLWLLGYSIHYVPESVVYHKHRGSWGKKPTFRVYLGINNRMRNMLKYLERRNLILGIILQIILITGEFTHYILDDRKIASAMLAGGAHFIKEIPTLLRQRKTIQAIRKVSDAELIEMGVLQTFDQTLNCLIGKV